MGGDPHFSIVPPDNHMLCYTVQGEPGLIFNLTSNVKLYMNALFGSEERNGTFIGALVEQLVQCYQTCVQWH